MTVNASLRGFQRHVLPPNFAEICYSGFTIHQRERTNLAPIREPMDAAQAEGGPALSEGVRQITMRLTEIDIFWSEGWI